MNTKRNQQYSTSGDCGLSQEFMDEVTRRIEEREALNPSPPPPPEVPWPDKPHALITAEKELMRWEILRDLQVPLCQKIAPCMRAFCRRHKRCLELDEIDAEIAKVRTRLEALQAKWPAPKPKIAPPPATHKKKGRTRVRP